MEDHRQLKFKVAYGLLHYELTPNLGKGVRNFHVASTLKGLFTPALSIPLKLQEMGV
jgi:hypothetical protein